MKSKIDLSFRRFKTMEIQASCAYSFSLVSLQGTFVRKGPVAYFTNIFVVWMNNLVFFKIRIQKASIVANITFVFPNFSDVWIFFELICLIRWLFGSDQLTANRILHFTGICCYCVFCWCDWCREMYYASYFWCNLNWWWGFFIRWFDKNFNDLPRGCKFSQKFWATNSSIFSLILSKDENQ